MVSINKNLNNKIHLLKEARLQLLRLHKLLVDDERQTYEHQNGQVSSGQFLQLLLSHESFSWLRKFSTLIVEIDELLDLNDGFTQEMIEKHFAHLQNLLDFDSVDKEFNLKYKNSILNNLEIEDKHKELKNLLMQK
ncbi:MAG: hypothetical protein LC778_19015 [Acidobacteria bacterium]|nr:hypothetical protein [Acidobacteriota bacterium]